MISSHIIPTLYANLALKGPRTKKFHADLIHDSFHNTLFNKINPENLVWSRITPVADGPDVP